MSKDYRDQRGGHRRKWAISADNYAEFRRINRKIARGKVKAALRKGEEPEPLYPVEREWYD